MSPFPYVITTHGPGGDDERAVATLEKAQGTVDAILRNCGRDKCVELGCYHIPEHGGTVTLHDGTEITVTPYRWLDLAACANVRWEDTPECRAAVLEAFNARERVA